MSTTGIFYMLTATETQHLRDTFKSLLSMVERMEEEGCSGMGDTLEETTQALEILEKLKPLDLKTIKKIISEGEE